MARLASATAATASLSAAPGARLKLMVIDGNCSWCAITSGAEMCSKRASVLERHLHAAGAGDVELRQRIRVLLVARLRFEDDAVLVGLRIDRGNLPLAEGAVECVVDRLHRNAEPAGLLAIDLDLHAQAALLRLRGDVAQPRILLQPRGQLLRPFEHFAGVGADQRVLVLRPARARADLDVLHRLEVDGDAGDRRDRLLQARDDLIDAERRARRAGAA